MRPWQFSRPKNPGFGISTNYYLTVLASSAVLPAPRLVANPKGSDGAAMGFCVPLNAADKSALEAPMQRGAYTLATKDQKTVLSLFVISKEEAGFDPEAFAQSSLSFAVPPEALARIRGTWNLIQLKFESHDAMVYPALDFLLGCASRLAQLSEGVVADPLGRRYQMPEQVFSQRRRAIELPVYAEEHVTVHFLERPDGIYCYTLGMQKFAMAEYELTQLRDGDEKAATIGLLWLAQQQLMGTKVDEGFQVGAPKTMFELRQGGFDRAMWEGIPVLELLPPTSVTSSDALRAWNDEIGRN